MLEILKFLVVLLGVGAVVAGILFAATTWGLYYSFPKVRRDSMFGKSYKKSMEIPYTTKEKIRIYTGVIMLGIFYIFVDFLLFYFAERFIKEQLFIGAAFAVLGFLLLSFVLRVLIGYKQ